MRCRSSLLRRAACVGTAHTAYTAGAGAGAGRAASPAVPDWTRCSHGPAFSLALLAFPHARGESIPTVREGRVRSAVRAVRYLIVGSLVKSRV